MGISQESPSAAFIAREQPVGLSKRDPRLLAGVWFGCNFRSRAFVSRQIGIVMRKADMKTYDFAGQLMMAHFGMMLIARMLVQRSSPFECNFARTRTSFLLFLSLHLMLTTESSASIATIETDIYGIDCSRGSNLPRL